MRVELIASYSPLTATSSTQLVVAMDATLTVTIDLTTYPLSRLLSDPRGPDGDRGWLAWSIDAARHNIVKTLERNGHLHILLGPAPTLRICLDEEAAWRLAGSREVFRMGRLWRDDPSPAEAETGRFPALSAIRKWYRLSAGLSYPPRPLPFGLPPELCGIPVEVDESPATADT